MLFPSTPPVEYTIIVSLQVHDRSLISLTPDYINPRFSEFEVVKETVGIMLYLTCMQTWFD